MEKQQRLDKPLPQVHNEIESSDVSQLGYKVSFADIGDKFCRDTDARTNRASAPPQWGVHQ